MHILKIFVLILLLNIPSLARDVWNTYSSPFPIRSATTYKNGVILATDGGIRFKGLVFDDVFTAKDGLETSSFYSIMSTDSDVVAISEYGLIAKMKLDFSGWKILNRSYVENGDKAVPDGWARKGDILVIAFEKRLAFFNMRDSLSVLTIDRISNISLSVFPPEKIEIHGDSLYVALNGKAYVRVLNWSELTKDKHLIDPEAWTEAPASNMVLDPTIPPVVNGTELKNSDLYHDGKSIVKWILPVSGDEVYLASSENLWLYTKGKLKEVSEMKDYKLGEVYEITKVPDGGVLAASVDGPFAFSAGVDWSANFTVWDLPISNKDEAYGNRLKTLSVLPNHYVFYHLWGQGFFITRELGTWRHYYHSPGMGSCMDTIVDNYITTAATTVAPDSSGFLSTTASKKGYSLVYFSPEGDISCAKQMGEYSSGGPMQARIDEDGNWIVYVGSRVNGNAYASGGVDMYKCTPPSRNGGRLACELIKRMKTSDNKTPVDMVLDEKHEMLWFVTTAKIGYLDYDQDSLESPHSIKGLQSPEITSLDLDVRGNLWVGTTSQGAYRLSRTGNSFDSLTAARYTTKNGMLEDDVADLAIDPVYGIAWFAHANGITSYKRNDLRGNSSFMTDSAKADVKAYPNPFRVFQHVYVTIDNIDENATVSIFNRGGSLVRFFRNEQLLGGKAEWDGKGADGKYVAPGVYQYVVKSSKKKKKGKIIVIH